jgi:hypothetical protein
MAERRIRQCEYELKHWQNLLKKRDEFIKERDKD